MSIVTKYTWVNVSECILTSFRAENYLGIGYIVSLFKQNMYQILSNLAICIHKSLK